MREEIEVREQYLNHAGAVDEIGDVGLGDGAPILGVEPSPTVSIPPPS
jgi:hypothetical protein